MMVKRGVDIQRRRVIFLILIILIVLILTILAVYIYSKNGSSTGNVIANIAIGKNEGIVDRILSAIKGLFS